jgi:hypothetical protein
MPAFGLFGIGLVEFAVQTAVCEGFFVGAALEKGLGNFPFALPDISDRLIIGPDRARQSLMSFRDPPRTASESSIIESLIHKSLLF